MKRIASIDIGTQTIRILIADCYKSGLIKPVFRDRQIIRLGQKMGIKNLPAIVINGALAFSSLIPNKRDLFARIERVIA